MNEPTPTNELLAAALVLAASGVHVLRLHYPTADGGCSCGNAAHRADAPKTSCGKHPNLGTGWQKQATTHADTIRGWWAEVPDSNVGMLLSAEAGIAAIDVDSEEGERVLAELCGGDLPPTWEFTTGKGRRFLFRVPAGLKPKTVNLQDQTGDEAVRFMCGANSQTVVPPSRHYTGVRYQWVDGCDPASIPLADMPGWMVGLMCPPEAHPEQYEQTAPSAFAPGADYNRRGSWAEFLAGHGFKPSGRREATRYFTRPGKGGGTSVSLGHYRAKDGSPALYVFTGSIPGLGADRCYDLFGAYARLDHRGDFAAASRALEAAGFGDRKPAAKKAEPAVAGDRKPWQVKPSGGGPGAGVSASALFTREFAPLRFAVDELLPEGLAVLAGKPKGGKSFFVLQLGWAVAAGQTYHGRKVIQGDVLYLALEDTERRMATRLRQLRPSVGYDPPEALTVHTSWPRSDQGGLYHVAEWLDARKGRARLVIVDTLAKFRPPSKSNGNNYAEDYEAIGGLKELLDQHGVSGLIVHHTRKLKADDPFDEISGTTAISGAADAMWVLERDRGTTEAKLFVTGRDFAEGTVPMTCDPNTRAWTLAPRHDGIDTTGRTSEVARPGSKIDECVAWLRQFLAEYAHPSKEVEAAGKAAGFSFSTLKEAKTRLGPHGTKELHSRKAGQGEWWNGMGPPEKWRAKAASEDRKFGSSESRERYRRDTDTGDDEKDFF